MRLDRREFVFSLTALASAPPLSLFARKQDEGTAETGPLTDDEMETLTAICEQIIPEDDFPGARELGVGIFISRLLKEAHPDWISVYHSGLRSTDNSSLKHYKKPFTEIPFDQQTTLLQRMEQGDLELVDWGAVPPEEFFSMVRSHAVQGFYSHPRWGGNRDKKAWEMIGYDDWWV